VISLFSFFFLLDNLIGETTTDQDVLDIGYIMGELMRVGFLRLFTLAYYFNFTFQRTAEGKKFFKNIEKGRGYTMKVIEKKRKDYESKMLRAATTLV